MCIYGKETQELFVEKGVYACNVIISYCTLVTVYLIKSKMGCKISWLSVFLKPRDEWNIFIN